MLIYVCFFITLNLCIGYALGAYFGGPPAMARPRRREPATETSLVRPVAETAQPTTHNGQPTPMVEVAELPEVSQADILSGMAEFQQQLETVGRELKEAEDDPDSFDSHARRLQEVNHEYLQTAQEQIDQLDHASETHKSASTGVEQVDQVSHEIDAILEEDLADESTRSRLLEKTEQLTEQVGEAHQTVHEQVQNLKQERDAVTGLATLDSLLAQIDELLSDGGSEQLRTAALVRIDPPAGASADANPALLESLHNKLTEMIYGSLANQSQTTLLDDGQYLLLLEEQELGAITNQVEQLRQQIAETTFVRGEDQLRTTITCAVADLPGAQNRNVLMTRLREALAESEKVGANHTFHHDGSFATAVEPLPDAAQAQTIEL